MVSHCPSTRRLKHFDWAASPRPPGCEDKVRVSHGVVRMEMRNEADLEICNSQAENTFLIGGCGAANNTGPDVHQVRGSVADDRGTGAGALRRRAWISRAQKHDLRLRCLLIFSGCLAQR